MTNVFYFIFKLNGVWTELVVLYKVLSDILAKKTKLYSSMISEMIFTIYMHKNAWIS